MDRLAHPEALVLIPLVIAGATWVAARRRPASVLLPTMAWLPGATLRARVWWVPGVMRVAALVVLGLALSRPQDVIGKVRTSTEGLGIMLVIDRSASMGEPIETESGASTRMDVVKRVVREFMLGDGRGLRGREGDLVGLVAFARYADTICPLVRSPEAVVTLGEQMRLADARSLEGGTAIGDGLALAAARLRNAEEDLKKRSQEDGEAATLKSKVVILLTDGQDNASRVSPLDAANLAAEWGIRVHTIAVGAGERTMRVRTPFGDRTVPVGGEIDEELLREIAKRTGGSAFRAQDAESLREVYERIDEMEKVEIRSTVRTHHEERYRGLAIAAMVLVAVEGLVASLWLRRAP